MTNDELHYVCDYIRKTVPCDEAGRAMGISMDSKGRCRCFFHGGDHRNLKLYGRDRGYYCFVCHESGDVIHLVMGYTQCSFMEAIEWLNDSFGLGIEIAPRNDPYERRRRQERRARTAAGGAMDNGGNSQRT